MAQEKIETGERRLMGPGVHRRELAPQRAGAGRLTVDFLWPAGILAGSLLLIVLSRYFLDARLALLASRIFHIDPRLPARAFEIPDLLLELSIGVTAVSWMCYYSLRRKGADDWRIRLALLVGWTVPVCFLMKTLLKYVFGRLTTRMWLLNPGDLEFHFFHGGDDYTGFPSGHMTVFTVLMLALWRFKPRYRYACAATLALLGAALVASDYHFPSDVIGGFALGFVVDYGLSRVLEKKVWRGDRSRYEGRRSQ